MIVDGAAAGDAQLVADVLVVGAGAAGIPAALQLERSGLSVLLIESGGDRPTAQADDLSRGSIANPQHAALDRYRVRALGGTTKVWGGRVAPLDDLDFQRRDWIPGSGWPIGRSDLDPHYVTAHRYLSAGEFDYSASTSVLHGPRATRGIPRFSTESFHDDMLWRFSDPVDLGRRYEDELRRSALITVLLNTTATSLVAEDGRISATRLRTLSGRELTAVTKVVLLAGGGLETTRLLHASDPGGAGLGNESGALGRYYTSHLAGLLGPFTWSGSRRLPGMRYERDPQGVYVKRTLSLRPESQESAGLLNFRCAVSLPAMSDPSHNSAVLSAAFLAKRFVLKRIPPEFDAKYGHADGRELRSAHIRNVVRNLPELATFAPWWLAKRIVPTRKVPSMEANPSGTFFLHFDAEQTPLRESTVMLADERDAFGVPRLVVDWRVADSDVNSLARSYTLLARQLNDAGIAAAAETEEQAADRVRSELGVGSHHIGTTRMSVSSRDGVVDVDARVHGVSNLFVGSASAFPTAGVANPTLTITALAIRCAHTISRELGVA